MDSSKKRLFIIVGAVALIIVVFIIVVMAMGGKGGPSNLTYQEAENEIKEVAEEYYKENSSLLPKEGNSREISVDDLVKLELIRPLNELIKDGEGCTGKVTVKNIEGKYSYVPYIKCGDDYVTSELYNKVITDNPVVDSRDGLYQQGEGYIFRGENINNFIKFADKEWRIMSIDYEGNMQIILNSTIGDSAVWDDRYNSEKEYESGINKFGVSRIKDTLEDLYESDDLVTKDLKEYLVPKDICITGIGEEDSFDKFECKDYAENMYVSLINVYEFVNTSIDPECTQINSKQCQNYNYLKSGNDSKTWWTMTPNKENTYELFYIETYGTTDLKNASNYSYIRPIVYISKDVMYKSGKGTQEDPYVIE